MAFERRLLPFDDEYKEKCFQAWFLAGCPGATATLGVLPDAPDGRRPSVATITNWMDTYQWKLRAADLNAKALAKTNEALVNTKAELLQLQMENSKALAQKALESLLGNKFDTSSAAVQAYFRATAEQRTVMGLSELMQRIGNMTDDELQKKIAEMAERVGLEDATPLEEEILEQK